MTDVLFSTRLRKRLSYALAALSITLVSACAQFPNSSSSNAKQLTGTLTIKGLAEPVVISRTALNTPLIQARNAHDLLFAQGFLHAEQHLKQMMHHRAIAYGRLAEINGSQALNSDFLMRSVGIGPQAQQLYKAAPPAIQNYLQVYARGINAYLYQQRAQLPPAALNLNNGIAYWRAEDSLATLLLLNFSLSGNLFDELLSVQLLGNFSPTQAAALLNIQDPESLAALTQLKATHASRLPTEPLLQANLYLDQYNALAALSSSQWAVSPVKTKKRSLLATDWHANPQLGSALSISQWQSPQLKVAGFSLPGFPSFLAGSNQQLVYSFAGSNADQQDLFTEQLSLRQGKLWYREDKGWQPVTSNLETFAVKGQTEPVRRPFFHTKRGTLLHSGFYSAQQLHGKQSFSLALAKPDNAQALVALFRLMQLQQAPAGVELASQINLLGLEVLFADPVSIAWQTTGTYPSRGAGQGLVPLNGWEAGNQWQGLLESSILPYDINPRSGVLLQANDNRNNQTGLNLSNQGNGRFRAQRLEQRLAANTVTGKAQLSILDDIQDSSLQALQQQLQLPHIQQSLNTAIAKQTPVQQQQSRFILQQLLAFNGQFSSNSIAASIFSELFTNTEQFLLKANNSNPSAIQLAALNRFAANRQSPALLHLIGQDDSPLWRNNKGALLAQLLLQTHQSLTHKLGSNSANWQLSKLYPVTQNLFGSSNTPYMRLQNPSQQQPERVSRQRMLFDFSLAEPLSVGEQVSSKKTATTFNYGYLPFASQHQSKIYQPQLRLNPK